MKGLREGAVSVCRTILGTFTFTGRSRRLDVADYLLASMLASAALHPALAASARDYQPLARTVSGIVIALPFFALFVRRLHDQGRSGWWALALPPIIAANLYETLRASFHPGDPQWPALGYWTLALAALAVLYLAMLIVPGTIGSNRYGPDPRLEDAAIEAFEP